MESLKLNRTVDEELEEFCAGCNKDDLRIYYKMKNNEWAFGENDHTKGKKTVLTCEYLDKCTRLYQYLKERQNG